MMILSTASSYAGVPAVVKNAAKAMKTSDVRSVVTAVNNQEGNPCIPEGVSYNIDLQVKTAAYNRETQKIVYTWETVKTINSDAAGHISEVCAE